MLPRIDTLLAYASDSELKSRYSRDIRTSQTAEIYDFSLIVAWKLFMLFIYERLWQMPSEDVKSALDKNKDLAKHYKVKSWLWANSVDDDALLAAIDGLYPSLDHNYLKRARSIHHQRKAAAHVSDIINDIHAVDAFLKELIAIADKVQECHHEYLDKLEIERLPDIVQEKRLSSVDLEYLIDSLIVTLRKCGSFEDSTSIRAQILQLSAMLTRKQIDAILKAIEENSSGHLYHQILQASGGTSFVRQLYDIHAEPTPSWGHFAKYLARDLPKRNGGDGKLPEYNWLFTIFEMPLAVKPPRPVIPGDDEPVNLDDIPF